MILSDLFNHGFYKPLAVNAVLHEAYETKVCPVNILKASKGFNARTIVALFPENHINGTQRPIDSIFYFINQFIQYFFLMAHKVLLYAVGAKFLDELKKGPSNRKFSHECGCYPNEETYHE